MAKELDSFIKALNEITSHILQDDDYSYDKGVGVPNWSKTQDDDFDKEPEEEPAEKIKPMMDQLGKIVDSDGNPNPVTTVSTNDGKEVSVTPQQAKALMLIASNNKVKPDVKAAFQKDIQSSAGLEPFLVDNPKEMISMFVSKYVKKDSVAEPSKYA